MKKTTYNKRLRNKDRLKERHNEGGKPLQRLVVTELHAVERGDDDGAGDGKETEDPADDCTPPRQREAPITPQLGRGVLQKGTVTGRGELL